ncbi:MAG TPA: cupin domain-containing protein [Dehalococcoidia bacterium]|nr:cupin domain-containing protein [Dehalococcoidia bacterium]
MHVIRGSSVQLQRARREIFTGEVETHTYVDETLGEHLRLSLVRFKAGARTKWHRHAFEQALLITEGRGVVATDAAEHVVEAGDVVVVPAGERHWHGGTESTAMAHISITTPGETTVLEPVDRIRSAG